MSPRAELRSSSGRTHAMRGRRHFWASTTSLRPTFATVRPTLRGESFRYPRRRTAELRSYSDQKRSASHRPAPSTDGFPRAAFTATTFASLLRHLWVMSSSSSNYAVPRCRTWARRFRSPSIPAASTFCVRSGLAPAELWRDVLQDALDDVGVVFDTELVGHRQQQRVRRGDRLVLRELLDELVRCARVAPAEHRTRVLVQPADRVAAASVVPEVRPVALIDEREDASADRDAGLARVTCFFPGRVVRLDLLALLD